MAIGCEYGRNYQGIAYMDLISLILFVLRGFLAYIFLVTGWNKYRHIHIFEREVADYELLPAFLVRPFAIILPLVEIGVGTMLLMGWGVKLAAILTMLLLMIFIVAMGINLVRGRRPNCGCSGAGHHRQINLKLIAYDFFLILLSLPVVDFGSFSPTSSNILLGCCLCY
jgi:uncharacterized membrane protein YphA (DoxX/SURF4 family)